MEKEFKKLLEYWENNEGTAKLFNFKFIEYKKGYLKLEAEFGPSTLNPNKNVQGGQMTSMLDDATSILVVLDTGGKSYPNSTNLHSLHHRPLFQEKVTVVAETIKIHVNIFYFLQELVFLFFCLLFLRIQLCKRHVLVY